MQTELRDPPELTREAEALVGIARDAARKVGEAEALEGLASLRARLDRRQPIARPAWIGAGLAAAAVFLLVGLSLVRRSGPAALAFHVDGGELRDGYVESSGGAGARLAFSDGSVLTLSDHTRLHIHSVGPHGGRFALEDGRLQVDVAHRDGSDWRFHAGPFQVEVKGTAFSLGWKGTSERLDLRLVRGAVAVHGPSAEPLALHAGQRLSISVPDKRVLVQPLDAPETDETAPPAPDLVGTATTEPAAQAPMPSTAADTANRAVSWASALAAGHASEILDEIDRRGLEPALAGRGSADLAALADAARYKGRIEIAERALNTLRKRFPKSMAGIDAAFQLGRIEQNAHPEEAIRWYDRYLEEAPAGPYASEALGRKMTAMQKLYGKTRAQPIAEKYLESYPQGAYAAAARAIVRAP
jgi:hypothetical protein